MLIDSHCHFNNHRLDDVDACIERAKAAGVERMIVVGYDLESSEQAVKLAVEYSGLLYAAVGIHPHDARSWSENMAERIRNLADQAGVVAIGEIGLDYYRDLSPRDAQMGAFREQLELAAE